MKKLIFIFILVISFTEIFSISEEMQELIDSLHKTCVTESGAQEDHIVNARKGVFADDENFKCYLRCLFDQMGCMTDDGKLDIEATIAILPPETVDNMAPIVRKCGTQVGSNPCETAWLIHKCNYVTSPEAYFLP